jgi:hypothetical protein
MDPHGAAAKTPEERLIFGAIAGGWLWYVLGALYILGPALAAILLGKYLWRRYTLPAQETGRRPAPIPFSVWLWIVGMVTLLLALLVAHVEGGLGFAQTLKSTIGWMKGWALLAAFPLLGACLSIRPEIVVRAMGWFAVQTLLLIPLMVAAALVHLPSHLYTSPLQVVGGPGPEFFQVMPYSIDPSNGSFRWQFIAPWAPAGGMLGNLMLILALAERRTSFRYAGIAAAILIALMTRSRMALLFTLMLPPLLFAFSRLISARGQLLLSGLSLLFGVLANWILGIVGDAVSAFRAARADSTRVREALGRIAVERWRHEAPIWGHGVVQQGSHYVEHMPIGSHHTWFGLLFVKGVVGVGGLILPLAWSFIEMLLLAQVERLGRTAFAIVVLIIFYSFGENLEILAYLYWPGLVILGAGFALAAAKEPEPETAAPAALVG